jgi:hypothetical protein
MQRQDIVNSLVKLYTPMTPIHRQGLELLYSRAENRGYSADVIMNGLLTCIQKNYAREEYKPPNNDPVQEVIDERRYIEDWEFKEIFTGGN